MVSQSGGDLPWVLIDGGTFNHMFGTDVASLLSNIREVAPHPVKTTGGVVWLKHQADLHLGVVDIMGGHVNPYMDTTLIAEGKMVDQQRWLVNTSADHGKVIQTPTGSFTRAHRCLVCWLSV